MEKSVKKILCCASEVQDKIIAASVAGNDKKLKKVMESPQAVNFVKAAEALSHVLDEQK